MKIVNINSNYVSNFSYGIGEISCSYVKLFKLFGVPKYTDSYKSDYEWTLNLDSGDHINIYDWKVGKNYCGEDLGLEKEDIFIWNVGSNKNNLINFIKSLIESDSWNGFEESRLSMFMSEDLVKDATERVGKWD